jgi:hypothetical protein
MFKDVIEDAKIGFKAYWWKAILLALFAAAFPKLTLILMLIAVIIMLGLLIFATLGVHAKNED